VELRAHDLLIFKGPGDLFTEIPFPQWVLETVETNPAGVMRRAEHGKDLIPIGIRGKERGERSACWVNADRVLEVIRPFRLTDPANWKRKYIADLPLTVQSLQIITPFLNETGYEWGPAGSTGFELATGYTSIKSSSDLDLVIYIDEFFPVEEAKCLLARLEQQTLVPIDIQLQTPIGGVALKEYIRSDEVLLKSSSGPLLLKGSSLWE